MLLSLYAFPCILFHFLPPLSESNHPFSFSPVFYIRPFNKDFFCLCLVQSISLGYFSYSFPRVLECMGATRLVRSYFVISVDCAGRFAFTVGQIRGFQEVLSHGSWLPGYFSGNPWPFKGVPQQGKGPPPLPTLTTHSVMDGSLETTECSYAKCRSNEDKYRSPSLLMLS